MEKSSSLPESPDRELKDKLIAEFKKLITDYKDIIPNNEKHSSVPMTETYKEACIKEKVLLAMEASKDNTLEEIKPPDSTEIKWKVQNLWFQIILGRFSNLLIKYLMEELVIRNDLAEEVRIYLNGDAFKTTKYTKQNIQKYIDEAEAMINKVIAGLEE